MSRDFADIALRLAVPDPLQFEVPEPLRRSLQPGDRVVVPLRKGRDVGYVVSLSHAPRVPGIRPIEKVLPEQTRLPADLLRLVLWISAHYLAPVGLALRAAVPRGIHYEGEGRRGPREVTATTASLAVAPEEARRQATQLAGRAGAQAGLLLRLVSAGGGPVPIGPAGRAAALGLERRGLCRLGAEPVRRGVLLPPAVSAALPVLNRSQDLVFERVRPALAEGVGGTFLLHGVTGSGKTEVYLSLMRSLPPDRQALLLVPEVSLTVQLVRHLRAGLPFALGVWHHQLSEGEKFDLWRAVRRGEVRAVLGTRSAVFAPFPRLGLIVVDEEQETSFKQEDTPCYHAREAAAFRAAQSRAVLLLGSATPSLESRHRADAGGAVLLHLPERYGGAPLPHVELVDLRRFVLASEARRRPGSGRKEPALLAPPLLEAARESLDAGDQVLLFLNRRGFAPHTQCRRCGAGISCPNCRVSLVYHLPGRELLCHYCGLRQGAPDTCPSCGAAELRLAGSGTQRLEQEIREAFPERRVLRLDRDTASRKGGAARVVDAFEGGEADILVGTQLVAKGLHFPRLTLVGVLAPDLLLNLPDFRAAERAFSLVAQVSGRAGRADRPGRVLVQTWQPTHYALEAARDHDYEGFYRRELAFREELGYPPLCEIVALRIDGPSPGRLGEASDRVGKALREILAEEIRRDRCQVLGPVPAPLEKIRNRWRSQIIVKASPLEAATGPLRSAGSGLRETARRAGVNLLVDVSPLQLM